MVDWRALYKPVGLSEDSKEHVLLAKGKEIKRSKDETRQICLEYINEFTKDNPNSRIKAQAIDDFQKETFWQRVGIKKVDKEKPLYAFGTDKLATATSDLHETMERA